MKKRETPQLSFGHCGYNSTCRVGLIPSLLLLSSCICAEPRWLLDVLPGEYPDIVYYFPVCEPLVALTLDDGPDRAATGELLELLRKYEARATFFLLSDNIPGNEQLVRRIAREGHELGNHLTRDEISADLDPEDFSAKLAHSNRVLSEYADVRWFRPGSGWYNSAMLEEIDEYDYRLVLASMAPLDARIPWPALIAAYMRATVRPGSVLILHTGKGRGERAVEVVRRAVPTLQRRGFQFVTLSELDLAARNAFAEGGCQPRERIEGQLKANGNESHRGYGK